MSKSDQKTTYDLLKQDTENGLELIYQRYGQQLYSYAITSWQLLEDEALELVYETLLKIISNFKRYKFESEKKFSSFVFTVFCNSLRRHYRDEKKRARRVRFLNFDEALFDDSNDSTALQREREVQAKSVNEFVRSYWEEPSTVDVRISSLQAVLDELEDWERILLLQRAQNVPYSRIAGFVDKPADQLKVYHQRARKKLMRRFLKKLETMKQGKGS